MKALIVDDSVITRRIITYVLKSHGIQTQEAIDGEDAMGILRDDDSIGLLTVDWNMPNMNGLELLNRIRGNSKYNGVKIFIVSASDRSDVIRKAKTIGADDFIIKPINKNIISAKLKLHGIN